ncbi:hypothetical protein N7481_013272 [Penicillium waksmanii]|uniref:uncharacterized protein n=1 Tax=Penicillium waksmanii TaxID=69791 RepID=UPI002547F41A|nr:uncharacterized protein N7481_013272 [Penicillium waksmanii]KAJ5966558.1 hypothetical protein N7481_013272 [Penicillium waksmanii]
MHRISRAKCPTLQPNGFCEPGHPFAIKQYVKSLNHLRKRLDGQSDRSATYVALATCLLFICFEMLQGNRVGALVHLRTGLRILCCSRSFDVQIGHQRDSEALAVRLPSHDDDSILCQLARSFARLDYDSTMFGERSPALAFVRHDHQLPSPMIIPRRFATIAEARRCLDFLANAVFSFRGKLLQLVSTKLDNQHTSNGSDLVYQACIYHASARTTDLEPFLKMTEEIFELKSDLEAWLIAFKLLSRETLYSYSLPVILLEVQHFYIYFLISTCRDTHEKLCDKFDSQFRHVVQLAGRFINNIQSTDPSSSLPCLTFTLESGIIPSLYLVALKCRTHSIRQEAIALLYKSRCQEGMWESSLMAKFVAEISRLECERACALEGGFGIRFSKYTGSRSFH